MTNPYEPPTAELGSASSARQRPLLVWIISLFYGATLPLGAVLLLGLFASTGSIDAAPPELRRLIHAAWPEQLRSAVYALLLTAFGVTFFALHRVAIPTLAIACGLIVGDWAARAVVSGTFPPPQDAARLALMLVVLWYARRLRARGVLR